MKVLYAEDEHMLAEAITTILEIENFEVDNAYDGQQAYDLLMNNNYDIAILDIMMPKIDGIEVLNSIREKGNYTPVIMLTAKTTTEDKITGLSIGADDYICKPFEAKELIARINSLIRRNSPKYNKKNYTFENLTLNYDKKEIQGINGCLVISQLECDILEILIKNANKKIKKLIFINDVMENDNIDTLHLYITYLQNKLKHLCVNAHIIESGNSYMLINGK